MKLVIVSNRIPVTISENLEVESIKSAGGLVSAISAYLKTLNHSKIFDEEPVWAGWLGRDLPKEKRNTVKNICIKNKNVFPVFIPDKTADSFYSGFCNRTIWPLFHYFTEATHFNDEHWDIYKKVNNLYAEQIAETINEGDVVWIHDYHLMLLPRILREKVKNIDIGFFLHIPFPTYEVFRLLPRRCSSEILLGILGADLIGFHIHDYTQYFLRCTSRILGIEHNFGTIYHNNRVIKIDTFPIGIDYEKINSLTKDPDVIKTYNKIKENFSDKKIILSVDRLDYTKGIINRLQSFEKFLEINPDWHEKVILYIIVVPSRTDVEHYQKMKRKIDEYIGRINGKYSRSTWIPVVYHYRYFDFKRLTALYMASDICLVTPLRDGMNLVAKEYIASRENDSGVLILSEMAGASQELGEAIIVNPNSIDEMSDAIKSALEMPAEEQQKRIARMRWRIKRYNVFRWGDDFIKKIFEMREIKRDIGNILLFRSEDKIHNEYIRARKRLLLIDYDGTLVPYYSNPEDAVPDSELLAILSKLSKDRKNDVFIISGRTRNILNRWFGNIDIGLIAEHGALICNNSQWEQISDTDRSFIGKLTPIFELFSDRLPGSFIEIKEFSICLHFRNSDNELAEVRSKELFDYLVNFTANINVQVIQGDKVLEVRPSGINKGVIVQKLIKKGDYDFIMAIGDDATDEDMFKILPDNAYSIKIGLKKTSAHFRLYNHIDTRKFLKSLSETI